MAANNGLPPVTGRFMRTGPMGVSRPILPARDVTKYSRDDYKQLREDLLEIAHVDEYSDLPMRMFRIQGCENYKETLSITIRTRSQLGAVIAFADRDFEMRTDDYRLWHAIAGERNKDDINEYAEEIVGRIFSIDDTRLVEIDEEIIIEPFTNSLTKSAVKK